MAIAGSRLALMAIFIIVGLYFLFFHKAPLPLNHEAVGLGMGDILSTTHIVHVIIGIIFILGGVLVWRKSRTVTALVAPGQSAQK
jgi:hypothetical protein